MRLTAGARLGRFEIRSPLGAGGMGEVYRARDSRLARDVAIKILPARFSADRERLARFEQEARAAGLLNHPNILAIYDTGTHDGAPFIVSELLDGETLGERLRGERLPARKAIDYARQIAHGLAAAHARGIVHRDLKPENLFVARDGRIKILDFGLAKLTEPVMMSEAQTDAPTLRAVNTHSGVVMGTVGYMSPEQVRGLTADHRADIFAFGAVLYEMLAGRRAFRGASAIETMNAILKEEPPEITEADTRIAPALESIMRRCLEKNPADRFQSTIDLAFAIEAVSGLQSPFGASASQTVGKSETKRERPAWIIAVAVLSLALLAMLALYLTRRAPVPEAEAVRFTVAPPEGATAFTYDEEANTLSLSPDGRSLAFTAIIEGREMLYVRPLDATEARLIAGTEGAASPFWSPDSRFIAFLAQGESKLKRVEASGNAPPVTICDVRGRHVTGTWNSEGVILFSLSGGEYGIYRVAATGGAPVRLIAHGRDIIEPNYPHFLPDGRRFLFRAWTQTDPHIFVASLDSPEARRLIQASSPAVHVPPGYLFYAQARTILAQRFDAATAQVSGEPFTVAERVRYFQPTGNAVFSVSENGVLAFQSGARLSRLVRHDRAGRATGTVGEPGEYLDLHLSPDDARVVVSTTEPRTGIEDLWIYDIGRGHATRFTSAPDDSERWPVWSPDARSIVFGMDRGGPPHLYRKNLNETGDGEEITPVGGVQGPNDWSVDGRFIIYLDLSPDTNTRGDLWLLDTATNERRPFLRTPFIEMHAQFSPDGRWVTYVSDESGRPEVYVSRFDAPGERERVSTAGGTRPRWRRDGRELFFISADNRLMAATVRASGEDFEAGRPVALFNFAPAVWLDYDVTADGQHFLSIATEREANAVPITVVANWSANLRR